MEREEIIKKIYRKTTRYYRNNIKLSKEVIEELFSGSAQLFDMPERDTEIFRKTIGLNTDKCTHKQIAQQYNIKRQRITQIYKKMIDKMYEKDARIRINKTSSNEDLLNSSIQILRFENKILDFLRQNGYTTIKDLFENQERIKEICILKGINYENIFNRIKKLGLKTPEDKQQHVKYIEDIDMSPKTYKHLKKNNINTNHDLINNINELMSNPKIPQETKKQIKKIYYNETEKLENNKTISLLAEQKTKEESLKKSQEAGTLLEERIDLYLEYIKRHLPKEERIIAVSQLQLLLNSAEKNSQKIIEKEEELKKISDMILETTTTVKRQK